VEYPKDGNNYRETNVFSNWHNWDYRKTAHEWEAAQFHWHGPSEHTIDGQRFDLELHVVHFSPYKRTVKEKEDNGGYIGAVLGVIFDSSEEVLKNAKDYEIETSNELFETLFWNVTEDKREIKELKIGDFLSQVDATTRWTYQGSLTTPPCS
jgi:carbonic anhydrase